MKIMTRISVCALIAFYAGIAISDTTEIAEDIDWTTYNDDDGTPDFEDTFASGLFLSTSSVAEDYGFGSRADYWGDCEYVDTTYDRIECDIDNDHLDYISVGLADYLEGGSKIVIMCYDDGTDVTLAGWAKIQSAHKLYVNGSPYSEKFGIVRESTYYTAACDFADFPNSFDYNVHAYGELRMIGNSGTDEVSGSQHDDSQLIAETVYGKQGDDVIIAEGTSSAQLYGNYGDDNITGTVGADTIYGGNDSDTISAGSGNDYVEGGPGGDTIHGDDGNDTIYGEGGDDHIYGDDDYDELSGGTGNDIIEGGDYRDKLWGDEGDDWLYGYTSTNYYDGYIDYLYGNEDEDHLFGITNDYCWGGIDSDECVCQFEWGCNY